MQAAQFHCVVPRIRVRYQQVLVDLAKTGRIRPHFRHPDPVRNQLPRGLQPLENQLAREIDIRALFKDHGDTRQPGFGDGPNLLNIRQRIHHRFNGIGDQLLDFLSRKSGRLCINSDLDVCNVGESIKIQFWYLKRGRGDKHCKRNKNQQAVLNRPVDNSVEHNGSRNQWLCGSKPPLAISEATKNAPRKTTRWPAARPETSRSPPIERPSSTSTGSYSPSASST